MKILINDMFPFIHKSSRQKSYLSGYKKRLIFSLSATDLSGLETKGNLLVSRDEAQNQKPDEDESSAIDRKESLVN